MAAPATPPPPEWIKETREKIFQMTQDQFAVLLGVHRTMLARWETGVNKPSYPHIWKMIFLRDRKLREQGGAGVDTEGMNDTETSLLDEFRQLSPRQQLDVIKYAVRLASGGPPPNQPPPAPKKG